MVEASPLSFTGTTASFQSPSSRKLSFWQLWNMSFGFLGIQFGWGLQMANASAIFESLGAQADQLPILWLAAPLSGLIIQPVIGYLSDHTWTPLGRRRPFFLVGAILSSIALVLMPNAPSLWVAAGLLWLLDASANISMTPFRSFIVDLVPTEQQTKGFVMQSLLHGLGVVLASALPWLMAHLWATSSLKIPGNSGIPTSITLSFYVGAVVFLGAVLWTVVTTSEPKPLPSVAPKTDAVDRSSAFQNLLQSIWVAIATMPATMRQLAWVQCFSWLGLFCMFLYLPPAIAHNIFGANQSGTPLYSSGIEWAGLCMATYNFVCCLMTLVLPQIIDRLGERLTHSLCLCCGGIALISLITVHDPYGLLLPMIGVGVALSSILSLPYAMLVESLPSGQNCLYMGIFNCFIVLPEIVASLGLGWVMHHGLGGDRMAAVVMGGCFMLVGAVLTQRIGAQDSAL